MLDRRLHFFTIIVTTPTALLALLAAGPFATQAVADGPRDRAVVAEPETIIVTPLDSREGIDDLVGEDAIAAAAARAIDEPAFVTVIRIDDHAGETTSVAQVLSQTIGASVRSLGGLGTFASLSVRGAPTGHTAVLVDGVPLSRLGSVTADLGRFELSSFSSLELYRGGVPAEFGGSGLGGALNMVTRLEPGPGGERILLSAGIGSFATRHLRGRFTDVSTDGRDAYQMSAGYRGTDGDYQYFNDNGTNLNTSDDSWPLRTNNGYDQGDAVGRYRRTKGDSELIIGGRWQLRHQGIPGSASVQSQTASLTSQSQLIDSKLTVLRAFGSPRLVARTSAFVLVERQRYRDLDGEVGLAAQNRRYWTIGSGAHGKLTYVASRAHTLTAAIDGRFDYFADRDLLQADSLERAFGMRWGTAVIVSDEISLGGDMLVITPAVRAELQQTIPASDTNSPVVGPMDLETRTDVYPSPRISARLRALPWLAVKTNAGFYFRAPTALELFGDRGFVIGNPRIDPETGLSADFGIVMASSVRHSAFDRMYVEAAAFGSRPRNTIVLVPTAGLVTVAQNVGDAMIYGGEVSASLRAFRTATATANYTFIDSRQQSATPSFDGKRLPQRPRHQLYGRIDIGRKLAGRLFSAWGDVSLTSGNFLDPANINQVPARQLFGAGIKLEPMSGLLVAIEGRNLGNQRVESIELSPPPRPDLTTVPRAVSDFFGYPLPGRAFYLTIDWEY